MHPLPLSRRNLLCALSLWPVWRHTNAERLAPQLVLACEASLDIDPSGFLVSEKYDGVRAHWDGRQLRFRSGRFVTAPPWFLAR